MRAVVVERFGGPEVLRLTDRPQPEPGPGEIRVAVVACGVCRHDALTRAGAFPAIALPVVLGHQVAGVVDAVGPGASGYAPGDRVLSLVHRTCGRCEPCGTGRETLCRERPRFLGEDLDGGYAERLCGPTRSWVPLPANVSAAAGATLTCTFGTAYHAVLTRARVTAGETVLVTGASGGVGSALLPVLRLVGARILAVTRNPARADGLREAGADEVVVAPDGAYRRAVKDLTGGVGADAVLDVVGGPGLTESLHAVRAGGRVVVVGNVGGGTVELRPAHLILKEIGLLGTKSVTRQELIRLLDLVARGGLTPPEPRTLPLAEVRRAHEDLDRSAYAGRTVLAVEEGG